MVASGIENGCPRDSLGPAPAVRDVCIMGLYIVRQRVWTDVSLRPPCSAYCGSKRLSDTLGCGREAFLEARSPPVCVCVCVYAHIVWTNERNLNKYKKRKIKLYKRRGCGGAGGTRALIATSEDPRKLSVLALHKLTLPHSQFQNSLAPFFIIKKNIY